MLLKCYALSAWFAGRKSELYADGAAFLFGNVLFFIAIAVSVFFLSTLPFKFNVYLLLIFFLLLAHTIFYGFLKRWTIKEIDNKKIVSVYQKLDELSKKKQAHLGLVLFVLSFVILNLSLYLNFQGYFNN